ncbi:formate dehydrogenase subunit gamma [Candidatus Hydrogenedentota bacterium]
MTNSQTRCYIGVFLLGCVCVLAGALVLRATWFRTDSENQVGLVLSGTADLGTVATDATDVAGSQSYSVCVCPSCGTTVTQTSQTSCTSLSCPVCGSPMVRPNSVFAWREVNFRPIVIGSLITVSMAILAHYLIWGPKRLPRNGGAIVKRYATYETGAHFVAMLSFLMLAVTGFTGIIGPGANISGSIGGDVFLILHYVAAAGFVIGLAAVGALWLRDCFFKKGDGEWMLHAGGYFGYKGELSAERFNPGQKAFFWCICGLGVLMILTGLMRLFPVFGRVAQQTAYMVHDTVALFLVLGVVVHAYLGTVANPGSWQGVFSGWVTEAWAKSHHPDWSYELE